MGCFELFAIFVFGSLALLGLGVRGIWEGNKRLKLDNERKKLDNQ